MSMVHASRGFVSPASPQLRSEPAIVAGLAKATLPASAPVDWDALVANYDLIRDRIEAVLPDLFRDYNARIREPGGFRLPVPSSERIWKTPSGKAQFIPFALEERDVARPDPSILRLTTLRSHDQFNTTIYGFKDRYRGVFGRRDVLFMNSRDIERLNLEPGGRADVWAVRQPAAPKAPRVLRGLTVIDYPFAEGSCGAYYPEANCLVALEDHDPDALTPAYKSVPVRVLPADPTADSRPEATRVGAHGLSGQG